MTMPSPSALSIDKRVPEVELGVFVNTGNVAEAMVPDSDVVCSIVLLVVLISSL